MWGGAEDGESGGFRFNFGGDADAAAADDPAAGRKDENEEEEAAQGRIAGTEVLASEVPDPVPGWRPELVKLDERVTVVKGAVTSTDAANALGGADGDIARSDLVRGKYEGGFKLWECSLDLARHLLARERARRPEAPRRGRPGARMRTRRAGHRRRHHGRAAGDAVRLQSRGDPRAGRSQRPRKLRRRRKEVRDRFSYVGGDWGDLDAFVPAQSADVVLAAETIYSTASYARHVRLLRRAMRKPDGVALVAAKRYYFGVGGGTDVRGGDNERAPGHGGGDGGDVFGRRE